MATNKAGSGGQAFPRAGYGPTGTGSTNGITVRDYFAAKAMQGMCAAPYQPASDQHMLARDAYTVADAMLMERAK